MFNEYRVKKCRVPSVGFVFLLASLGLVSFGCGSGSQSKSMDNDLVSATDDYFIATRGKQTVSPKLTANDVTQQNDVSGLHIVAHTQAALGTVEDNHDGTFSYTPDDGKDAGEDKFTYTVSDEKGNTRIATVHVTLLAGWDTPLNLPTEVQTFFSFANGDNLALRAKGLMLVSQTYRHGSGWQLPKVVVSDLLDDQGWKAAQNPVTEAVEVVAMKTDSNGTAKVVTNEFKSSTEWSLTETVIAKDIAYFGVTYTLMPKIEIIFAQNRIIAIWNSFATVQNSYGTKIDAIELYSSYFPGAQNGTQWSSVSKLSGTIDPAQQLATVVTHTYVDSTGSVIVVLGGCGINSNSSYGRTYDTSDPVYLSVNLLPSAGASWAGPHVVTNSAAFSKTVAFHPQGHLSFAWVQQNMVTPGTYDLWTNRVDWDKSGVISDSLSTSNSPLATNVDNFSRQPQLSSDSLGNDVLLWGISQDLGLYASTGAPRAVWSTPVRLDVPVSKTEGRPTLQDMASIGDGGVISVWKKEYFTEKTVPGGYKVYEYAGAKLFATRFLNGQRVGDSPTLLLDTPVRPNDDNPSGFIKLMASQSGESILLTAQRSATNPLESNLIAQRLTNWRDPAVAPEKIQISNITGITSPHYLSHLVDANGSLSLFWSQDDGSLLRIFTSRLATKDGSLVAADAIQLNGPSDWMYTGGVVNGFYAGSSASGEIMTLWNLDRDGIHNVVTRSMHNNIWENDSVRALRLPIDGALSTLRVSNLITTKGGAPVLSLYVEGFGMNGNYLVRFH